MKKIFILCFITALVTGPATAAIDIPWWERPTICRLDPTNCYATMGAGFEREMWDVDSKCWGMKVICADALTRSGTESVPMGRTDIAKGVGIKSDFDTSALNGDCFGVRKTMNNGATTLVDGNQVNVWCAGILDSPDEYVTNGEITYGMQPTCGALAMKGYVGILNGKCYGKYYNPSEYYIECGDALLPRRMIILNGADYENTYSGMPTDRASADARFDNMQDVSKTQREKYFKAK